MNSQLGVVVLVLLLSVSIALGDSIEGELRAKVGMNIDVENRAINGMTHHYAIETASGDRIPFEGSHHELEYA